MICCRLPTTTRSTLPMIFLAVVVTSAMGNGTGDRGQGAGDRRQDGRRLFPEAAD